MSILRYTAAALLLSPLSFAQAGHWEGTFSADNGQIGVSLDLAKTPASGWQASMGVPSEGATGLVVSNVVVEGNSVKFVAVELMMAKFDLTLGPDGKLTGTITTRQGRPIPIEFKRTGDAKVELIHPSPAVSKRLEGEWKGDLQTPGGSMAIVIRFKNRPDNTVEATMETPMTGGTPVPLNDIKEAGDKVDFGVKVAHAAFHGTLNKEGTEITGTFGHEETSMPLTLKKS